jgi:zinc D-Ala-D-Ala carboxypeptidase
METPFLGAYNRINRYLHFKAFFMVISQHFTLGELIRSDSAKRNGINNMPNAEQIENLKALCEHILEPIREEFRVPIYISSAYRSKEANRFVGGSKTSQHCRGEAADIDMDGHSHNITNKDIFDFIVAKLPFDQVINEFNYAWVHVSYKRNGPQRKQILRAVKNNSGGTIYL